jgi:hypothetical protein
MKVLRNEVTGTQTNFFTHFGGELSFIQSFPFSLSASTATPYIFTAPTQTIIRIILEPCALNAEFRHFILKISLLGEYH